MLRSMDHEKTARSVHAFEYRIKRKKFYLSISIGGIFPKPDIGNTQTRQTRQTKRR